MVMREPAQLEACYSLMRIGIKPTILVEIDDRRCKKAVCREARFQLPVAPGGGIVSSDKPDREYLALRSMIFSNDIDRPFRNEDWVAVAFDRDNYDNTRLPDDVFEDLVEVVRADCARFIICGSMSKFSIDGYVPTQCEKTGTTWSEYKKFLMDNDNYAPEFFVFSESKNWGIWADMEITLLGGERRIMNKIIEKRGGVDRVLANMLDEFGVSEADYPEFCAYLKRLIDVNDRG